MPPDKGDESILVQRLSDGKIIYQSNPQKALIPASITKVITSAALLHYFSPAHTFKTRFYHSGTRQGDTIQGSLYIKGDGDPFVVNEKLWQMAADLKHMGIESVTGDLIIDNSLFDHEKRDRSRVDGAKSSENAYDAPVSAFGVNFNTLPVVIAPGRQAGGAARVSIDPYPLNRPTILNKAVTSSGQKSQVQAVRIGQGERSSLTVTGQIAAAGPMVKVYRAMGDPVLESAETVRAFLLEAGITIKGKNEEGKTPATAKLLYTLESFDLGYMVRGLNHFSNNYIADVLVKRLGAAFPKNGEAEAPGSGTLENGVAAIAAFLKDEVGLSNDFEIYNGSGLDSRNRFSATHLVKLLTYMQSRMEVYPEFLASFPASGWSGTLERRFKGAKHQNIHGMVRAKTGTLSEPYAVSTLAGYLGHPKHGALAFAFLNNGSRASNSTSLTEFRKRQDEALLKLIEKF
jgi:D-alanyl-D-alanine carboxypeptidase/D-alanyl-D-alanine-endopeptidase (penicillin-binding protein 4)